MGVFPDLRSIDDEEGEIIALSPKLPADTLLELIRESYLMGIFPWPSADPDEDQIPWYAPRLRGILALNSIRLPRSIKRDLKSQKFRITINQAFREVITACSLVYEEKGDGTWILPEFIDAYTTLHHEGCAISAEAWKDDELVGGIYGVDVPKLKRQAKLKNLPPLPVACESMFHTKTGASRAALLGLIEHLQKRGDRYIDIQTLSPHMKRLGAYEIARQKFLKGNFEPG